MIQNLWPTPFLKTKMSQELAETVANTLLLENNLYKPDAEFGSKNILDSDNPAIQRFKSEAIEPAFKSFLRNTIGKEITDWASYRTHGWITGRGYDYSINYHNHRGSQLSAVFYLLCEEPDKGGQITFTDPRQNSNRGYDENFLDWFKPLSFIPETGDIVVFPSFLYHYVSTYQGNIRLAVPVDLFLFGDR